MRLLSATQYMALERPQKPWLIDGFLPAGSFALLIGEPKAGKSYFALQLANAVAAGGRFLGRQCQSGSSVLYLNLDAADDSWNLRLHSMKNNGFVLQDRIHFVHPEDEIRPCNIMADNVQRSFRDAISTLKPDLIIIDVLRELHSQKEESSTEMKTVLDKVLGVTGSSAVIGIHHTVKISNKEEIRVIDLARGSSYLTGKAETIWCLMDNNLYTIPRFADQIMLRGARNNGLWVLPDLDSLAKG